MHETTLSFIRKSTPSTASTTFTNTVHTVRFIRVTLEIRYSKSNLNKVLGF